MMGREQGKQQKFFYYNVSLEQRVPETHILRKISKAIDFEFIYKEVADRYGRNGNVSVAPPVIVKLMLLLVLYNVRSEREMMETLPVRLDWLWFLGFDIDDEIPDHSVLSKARTRWGVEAFKSLFERVVGQCVMEGLVDGKKLFTDASLIKADASENSVIKTGSLKKYLRKGYRKFEQRLDELEVDKNGEANKQYVSMTDPDASVTRHGGGRSKLMYKTHRSVDSKAEVITATMVTAGSVDEGEKLEEIIEQHEHNTSSTIEVAVGDSRYGTKRNYLMCADRGIRAHLNNIEEGQQDTGRREGIYPKEDFTYDEQTDTYRCPAGQHLHRRNYNKDRRHYEYKAAKGACMKCHLQAYCTRAKDGRTLKRHERQEDLDRMIAMAASVSGKQDLKTRQHLSERSYARSTRYGFKRARWRGLWRMQIQDYLIAAVQNIQTLIRETERRAANAVRGATNTTTPFLRNVLPGFLQIGDGCSSVTGKMINSGFVVVAVQ